MTDGRVTADATAARPKRPRGAVREGLIAAGLELARTGGPDAVVLREATRIVGVVPNAAYRHFADRDALLAAVCYAAMTRLGERMAAEVARVRGEYGDPDAAAHRLRAIGTAYLRFAQEEPGLFAAAHALPEHHTYKAGANGAEPDRTPAAQMAAALDELVAAGVLDPDSRAGIEFPIWSTVHGLAVLTGEGPLREISDAERRNLENLTLDFIGNSIAFLSGGAEP
ncbi:MAG: TetR/AcrR family transcriptional regulator [Catenulispora sp.]